jgi:hypothetical protein
LQPSESVIPVHAEITVQTGAFTYFFAEMRTIFPLREKPKQTFLCKNMKFNHLLFGIFFTLFWHTTQIRTK